MTTITFRGVATRIMDIQWRGSHVWVRVPAGWVWTTPEAVAAGVDHVRVDMGATEE